MKMNKTGKGTIPLLLIITAAVLTIAMIYKPATRSETADARQLFVTSDRCLACHNALTAPSGIDISIGSNWQSSMMAHSSRDPYWQASIRRETIEHPESKNEIEDECSACHMPMARFLKKTRGQKGRVFASLPVTLAGGRVSMLAKDGVSCALCHQISEKKLGSEESFTAGFVIDTSTPMKSRNIYGPYKIDSGRKRLMESATGLVPEKNEHTQKSALCASCHTLYTRTRDKDGNVTGRLPEQVPYLEWLHSSYKKTMSCQNCHMPQLKKSAALTSVLPKKREDFSRHVFRGGNFFMLGILNKNRNELGVEALPQDLTRTAVMTRNHLKEKTATITIKRAAIRDGRLEVTVTIDNRAGHKLPTAYPSRRVWIHFTVRDKTGSMVFESGLLRKDGSIKGNDNDQDPRDHEPHYTAITGPEEVQIYESIMADTDDRVTTGLLSAIRFIKDNRVLPYGFKKETADADIAVKGKAADDRSFLGGSDTLKYEVKTEKGRGPYAVEAALWYQPVSFRWAQNLKEHTSPEIKRFTEYYEAGSRHSAVTLSMDTITVK